MKGWPVKKLLVVIEHCDNIAELFETLRNRQDCPDRFNSYREWAETNSDKGKGFDIEDAIEYWATLISDATFAAYELNRIFYNDNDKKSLPSFINSFCEVVNERTGNGYKDLLEDNDEQETLFIMKSLIKEFREHTSDAVDAKCEMRIYKDSIGELILSEEE